MPFTSTSCPLMLARTSSWNWNFPFHILNILKFHHHGYLYGSFYMVLSFPGSLLNLKTSTFLFTSQFLLGTTNNWNILKSFSPQVHTQCWRSECNTTARWKQTWGAGGKSNLVTPRQAQIYHPDKCPCPTPTSLCSFPLWEKNHPHTAPTPQAFTPPCALGYCF